MQLIANLLTVFAGGGQVLFNRIIELFLENSYQTQLKTTPWPQWNLNILYTIFVKKQNNV